jgi:hypothetical protein
LAQRSNEEIRGANWSPFFLGHFGFHVFLVSICTKHLPQHVLRNKKRKPICTTNFFTASLSRVYVSSSAPQSERNELTLLVLQDSRRLASTHSTATTLLWQDGSLVSRHFLEERLQLHFTVE